MHNLFRSLIAAVAVTTTAFVGGVATAAPAAAAPPKEKPIPGFTYYGDDFGTFGNHDFCRGSLHTRFSSPKRGVTRVTLTSFGFTGNGAGWRRNPRCSVLIGVTNSNGLFMLSEKYFPATFGARGGEKITVDIVTGSGFREIGVAGYALNTPVRLPQAAGVAHYGIVP